MSDYEVVAKVEFAAKLLRDATYYEDRFPGHAAELRRRAMQELKEVMESK